MTRFKLIFYGACLLALLAMPLAIRAEEPLRLTLEDAVKMAHENNRSILKADQDVAKAEGAVTEYKADAFPQIGFNFEWKHNLVVDTTEVDMGSDFNPLMASLGLDPIEPMKVDLVPPDEFTFNVGLTQNIYTFGRLTNAIKLAKAYVQMADKARVVTDQDVRLEVTQAYYQILYTYELVDVARISLAQAESTRDDLARKFAQGLVSEYDSLRAEVEAANRRPPYVRAKTAVDLAEKNLKRLLGLDLSAPIELTSTFREDPIRPDTAKAVDEALANRDEFGLLAMQYEASRREKNIYLSDMLPAISGFSDYTWVGSEQTSFGGSGDMEWQNFWTAGLRFYAPIFDGLRNWGRMQQAKADMLKLELDRLELEDGVRLEVESEVTTLEAVQEEFVALRKSTSFAERTVRLAKIRFENGLGTQLDVIDAETALAGARNNLADARYRFNVALAKYERALGRY